MSVDFFPALLHMRKLFAGLALLASASAAATAGAQASYRVVDVVNIADGFNARLEFRNLNVYGDQVIYAIGKSFVVSVSDRVKNFCTGTVTVETCGLGGNASVHVGPVQHNDFLVAGNVWAGGSVYSSIGSGFGDPYKFFNPWDVIGGEYGVLGCQVPARTYVAQYAGRTCDADGYTGWLSVDVNFRFTSFAGDAMVFDESDLLPTFTNDILEGANALNVVPEPGTYALMVVGLVAIGGVVRRRRGRQVA